MSGKVIKGILIGAAIAGVAFGGALLAGLSLRAAFVAAGLNAASFAFNALVGGIRSRQGVILQGVTDPQAPLPVVYGKTKVGVRYVDKRTGGTDNKDLYIVAALCHGSEDGNGIQGIDEIYFDDRLAVSADGVVQSAFIRDGVPFLFVTKNTGTDAQNYDGTLNSVFPTAWPTTSKGRGIAYIILKMVYDAEIYPTGEPTITAVVRGCKVKDPSNLGAAAAYSTNPARCVYDLLTSSRYGLGLPAAKVDAASFAAMATYYDTVVTKNSDTGTTGPLFSCNGALDCGVAVKQNVEMLLTSCRGVLVYEGGKYRIFTRRVVSPTSFALSEANIVGDWSVNVPGIGDAPNIVHGLYVEPSPGPVITGISTLSPATITTATPHGYVAGQQVHIYQIGTTAQGLTPPRLGVYTIDSITDSTHFVLKDNIAFGSGYVSGSCGVTTENLPHQVATRIWPRPGTSNGYLTADNNYEVSHEVNLPFTNDPYTAEQLILVALKEARAGITVAVTATEAALALQVGDLVPLTHPTPGWVSKNFWVMGVFLIPGTMLVRLALLEYDSSAYTLDALSTVPTPPSTNLPDPFICHPASNLDLQAGDDQARADRDGTVKVFIVASWDASPDPYIENYEVQYRVAGDDLWLPAAIVDGSNVRAEIGPVTEGAEHEVQVRAVNRLGVSSPWISDSITPELQHFRTGSFFIDDFSAQTPGRRWIPLGSFSGVFQDAYDPDGAVGGTVGRATGPVWFELADSIPYDPTILYIFRMRVRQLKDPSSGGKQFYLGFNGVCQLANKNDVYEYINVVGQPVKENQHFVLANGKTLPASRLFTDYYAYVQGFAGRKLTLTTAMLSQSGLGSYNAANLVDGRTDLVGFNTDSAVPGAKLQFDLGAPYFLSSIRFNMTGPGSTAEWDLKFADSAAGPWTTARTGITFPETGFESGTMRMLSAAVPAPTPPPPNPNPGSGQRTKIGLMGILPKSLWGTLVVNDTQFSDSNGANYHNGSGGLINAARAAGNIFTTQVTGGSQALIMDSNGDFSVDLAIAQFDDWRAELLSVTGAEQDLRDAVRDGVYEGIMLLDDFTAAGPGVNFTHAVGYYAMEAYAAHIKGIWPWMPLWVRGVATYMKATATVVPGEVVPGGITVINGVKQYRYIDYCHAQWRPIADGPVAAYYANNIAAGKACGLAVAGGINVLNRGTGTVPGWLCADHPGCSAGQCGSAPSEVRAAGLAALANPDIHGFMGWAYSCNGDTSAFDDTRMQAVWTELAGIAAGRPDAPYNIRNDLTPA